MTQRQNGGDRQDRVLIVEDGDGLRNILSDIIKAEGFAVEVCSTAREALTHIAREHFAILIVDLRLPDMDGMQLLGHVRATNANTRIIIHTGYGSFSSAKDAVNLGVSAYIEKGDNFTELIRALHRAHTEYLRVYTAELEARMIIQTEALVQSETRYRMLFENAAEGIYRCTPSGRFEAVNPALVQMLGYDSAEEVYALDIATEVYANPDDREKIRPGPQAPEVVTGAEVQVRKKSGEVIIVSLYSRAIYDTRGAVIAFEGSVIDVTEKVRAEKALQESERFARSTLDALSAHICVLDGTGTILTVNQAWREYAAKNSSGPVQVAEGVNYLSVCDSTIGEFAEQASAFAAGIRAVLNGERESFTREYYCPSLTAPGWFVGHVTKFASEGPRRVVVAHEDITEQKKAEAALRDSEALFRTLAETSQAGILILQGERIVYCNPALQQRSGYSQEELSTMPFWQLAAPEFHDQLQLLHLAVQQGHAVPTDYELKIVRKSGEERWVQGSIGMLTFRGQPAVLAVTMDITERTQAEAALRESEALFRTLAETSAAGILILQGERIVYCNPVVQRQSGYSQDELLTLPVLQFVPAEFHTQVKQLNQAVQQGHEIPASMEVKAITKSGEERWLQCSVGTLLYRGQPAILVVIMDVTERKNAEAALRESEELFRTLTEMTDVGIFILQGEKVIYTNPALSRQNGYSREEILAMPSWGPLAPEFQERFSQLTQAAKRGEKVYLPLQEDLCVITKSGAEQWVQVSRAFVTFQGAPSIITAVIDITERRRMEAELRANEALFRATFEQAGVGMAHVDCRGHWLLVNQKVCDILGYSREELLMRTTMEVSHPDEREAQLVLMRQVISGELREASLEKRYIRKDGSEVWVHLTVALVRHPSGKPHYLIGIMEDISARKQIEAEQARLVAILENTSDFVVTTTVEGRGVYMNRAGRELLGLASNADLSEWQGPQAYTESSRAFLVQHGVSAALRMGTWSGEAVVVSAAGKEIPISQVIIAHKNADGRADYLSVIARDISAQKKAEEMLQALSRRVLDAQEQERRHLARELHDELGQVLSAVKMTLQNGQRRPVHLAVRVEESVAMVQTALEQVRTLSRNLRPPMLDDLGLVAALRWYVQQQAKLMELEIQFVSAMPEQRFPLDVETVCFRVVQEALTNVMRYAHAQHVWVELRYQEGKIHLLVQDDGVGFDVEAASTQIAQGKSSGLLGMRERVQLIGGHIQVTSIKGVGTEVRAVFFAEPDSTQPVQNN